MNLALAPVKNVKRKTIMDALYAGLGRLVVRFRYLVVLAWLAVIIGGVVAFPSLDAVLKPETLSNYLPDNAPSFVASRMATPFFNPQYLSATLVASRDTGPLTDADQTAFDQVASLIRTMPDVTAVRDLAISQDGQARQAEVETDIGLTVNHAGITLVDAIRSAFGRAQAPNGLSFHLTGALASAIDTATATQASANNARNLAYLLVIILLLVAFRALLAPL